LEVVQKYFEDVAREYSDNRKNLSFEESEELLRIYFKYLKLKLESTEAYAIRTPLGLFTRKVDKNMLCAKNRPETRLEWLNEELFLSNQVKGVVRTHSKDYDNIERIKEDTNNCKL
jgi:hypothetical protein